MKLMKEIGFPLCAAIDATTTFALAPIKVPFPPRHAPSAKLHHIGSRFESPISPMSLISGIKVATKGILSINADAIADIHKIKIAVPGCHL